MTPSDLTSEAHSLLECVFSTRPAPVSEIENWLAGFEGRIIQGLSDRFLVLSEFEEKDMKLSERLKIASEVIQEHGNLPTDAQDSSETNDWRLRAESKGSGLETP